MTPGGPTTANSGFFGDVDSQGLLANDETGSNLGSDDDDDDKKNKNKRGKPKNRANRKKEEDDIFGDEDPQTAGYNAAVQIWKTVEAYFADFTDEDFKFLAVDAKDDAFKVPNLGKKAVLSSHAAAAAAAANAAHNAPMLQQSQSDMMDMVGKDGAGGLFGGPNGPNIVSKLIACLIEESSLPNVTHFLQARPPPVDMAITPAEMDPMFGIVPQQEAEFLENRLKKELTALGLFGDPESSSSTAASSSTANGTTPNGLPASGANAAGGASAPNTPYKETRSVTAAAAAAAEHPNEPDDDEVLAELKRLQQQLRQRLEGNNRTKLLLREQMEHANISRKKAKEERETLNKSDQHYVALHKAIIKKKKKPTGKQAAAAAKANKKEGKADEAS